MSTPRPYRSMPKGLRDHTLGAFGDAVCNRPPDAYSQLVAIYNGKNFLMSVAADHADAVARALNDAFAAGMAHEAARSPLRAMRDDIAGGEG